MWNLYRELSALYNCQLGTVSCVQQALYNCQLGTVSCVQQALYNCQLGTVSCVHQQQAVYNVQCKISSTLGSSEVSDIMNTELY